MFQNVNIKCSSYFDRGPIVRSSKTPELFFPRYSLVKDFYDGNLNLLNERLLTSDLSMVFYYAPWDRQCQDLQAHFIQVAKYYHEQVRT